MIDCESNVVKYDDSEAINQQKMNNQSTKIIIWYPFILSLKLLNKNITMKKLLKNFIHKIKKINSKNSNPNHCFLISTSHPVNFALALTFLFFVPFVFEPFFFYFFSCSFFSGVFLIASPIVLAFVFELMNLGLLPKVIFFGSCLYCFLGS